MPRGASPMRGMLGLPFVDKLGNYAINRRHWNRHE
jgi:hypothetical protein